MQKESRIGRIGQRVRHTKKFGGMLNASLGSSSKTCRRSGKTWYSGAAHGANAVLSISSVPKVHSNMGTREAGGRAIEASKLSALELAPYVLTFRSFPNSARKAEKERQFCAWWASFIASKRGMDALRSFESARSKVRDRTSGSVNNDVTTLWRLARACHGAINWSKQQDPGNRYRGRIASARRGRERLAYHARQLANGFEGWPPGLHWALRSAALRAGVGDIRDKLRKELKALPARVPEAERAKSAAWLRLDEKRSIAVMWPTFFRNLAEELRKKLPEIDGGPWLHLYTIGNLHYSKRIEGHVPDLTTMLAFELTFYLRRWSLGQADHVWASGTRMPKGGKPHNDVAASFINAVLILRPQLTGEHLGNRLKRLPRDIGLIAWPDDDG